MDERYQRGKIYTIRNRKDNSKIYVGSTIVRLSQRLAKHTHVSKKEENKNMTLYHNVNNDWSDWYIELYENFPCKSKEELLKREGEIIREIGTLNMEIAGRTYKEYYQDNKKRISDESKVYYQKNAEKIKSNIKMYRENNPDKKKELDRKYYEQNKDKIQEYHKQYREQNEDKIKERERQKIICECGCEVRKGDINRHQKTAKHQKLMEKIDIK